VDTFFVKGCGERHRFAGGNNDCGERENELQRFKSSLKPPVTENLNIRWTTEWWCEFFPVAPVKVWKRQAVGSTEFGLFLGQERLQGSRTKQVE
jgi:hypothetical protein